MTSIVYTLQPQHGYDLFAIEAATGLVYVTTDDPSALDYERRVTYELQVRLTITHCLLHQYNV